MLLRLCASLRDKLHRCPHIRPLQNGQLSERCAALTANISCLFNTAKLELQRKDDAIKELRERCVGAECWLRLSGIWGFTAAAKPELQRDQRRNGQGAVCAAVAVRFRCLGGCSSACRPLMQPPRA